MPNTMMPGNPRYQPKSLIPFFGYDNLAYPIVMVEIAGVRTLADLGVIPKKDIALLTPDIERRLLAITMTEVDRVEREDTEYGKATRHDIRALVRIMQSILPPPLRRWVHIPFTSYDPLDTARIITFVQAHRNVVHVKAKEFIRQLRDLTVKYAVSSQIGRTHGQHALPITIGFWLATILNRTVTNAKQADHFAEALVGKISGAVGAYNAQVGLGLFDGKDGKTFEEMVLLRVGLKPAPISTQILPVEPLAYYLFSVLLLSASIAQFGLDCRQLMRTEIAELSEPFEVGQVGSSTMAHKRNPMNFENTQGMFEGGRNAFGNVLSLLLSEHQRDLVGSSLARDLPVNVIKLVYQLETCLRQDKEGRSFLQRITVDQESCDRNLKMMGDFILAEPLYISLQMAGYEEDAHELVNHKALKIARAEGISLIQAVKKITRSDKAVREAWNAIPAEIKDMLEDPARYTGKAADKAVEMCAEAHRYLNQN